MRTHLDPTAPIAPQALVVDDPKLAMDLAIRVCEAPLMSNLAHGLWGYYGRTASGLEVTVQSLGIGGPSAAIVLSELGALGVGAAIRIGSCDSRDPELQAGARIVPGEVHALGKVAGALRADEVALPDLALAESVRRLTGALAEPTGSVDLPDDIAHVERSEVRAVDLSSAATLSSASHAGIRCCVALLVGGDPDAAAEGDAGDLIALGVSALEAFEPQAVSPGG